MAGEEVYDLLACYMRARTDPQGAGQVNTRPSGPPPERRRGGRKAEVQLGDP